MNIIYTAIFGGIDKVLDPPHPTRCWRYICFSDRDMASKVYEVIKVPVPKDMSPRRLARFYKINSHLVLPPHQISIWHDGNVKQQMDIGKIVKKYGRFVTVTHQERTRVKDEVRTCEARKRDDPKKMWAQYNRYIDEGFKDDKGLACTRILIRENTPAIRSFNELWWSEIKRGSKRDQISFPYVVWKTGLTPRYIPLIRANRIYFRKFRHKKDIR